MTTTSRNERRAGARSRSVEHPPLAERAARGKAARREAPRAGHAEPGPGSERPDPLSLMEQQARTRDPELVPIRHGRMLVSPFTFFRGAALLMASDLAAVPRTGLRVQLCGDAHLSNFGVFGSPERRLVFDINDFDETLPGPFEWDVKRLATSLEVAGRDRGFDDREREGIVRASVAAYRTAMADFASRSDLDVFYARLDVEDVLARLRATIPAKILRRTEKTLAKARTRNSTRALGRLTHEQDGELRITADPPLVVPMRDLLPDGRAEMFSGWARARLREYRNTLETDRRRLLERYEFVDLARKLVGVGSVGTRCWIALFLGRDRHDPLFLQLKEAQPSVLEDFAGRSSYRNAGHRVVAGQRLMQATGDVFLGWFGVAEGLDGRARDFYVRQLHDWKGSAEVEVMVPAGMRIYAEVCGWALARAHARSGDPVAIAAYLGRRDVFDRAVAAYSSAYADRNEADHALLAKAVASGRVEARTGV